MPTQKQFLDNVGLTKLLDELGQYLKNTIPTVNNATLTIQKNGTNVATFTANASTGATANITVPTATSDLTNDSGFLGDADVSYDANTKTLIIGLGSVTTYSVTSTYSGNISSNSYYTINNGEHVALSSPITISEGDKFYCFIEAPKGSQPVVTMGGNAITVTMNDPSSWYFTIPSVTGDVVISGGSGSGVIVG